MNNIGLILEGGGMRGAFTAGVLDYFMERGLFLPDIYGVSAGACQACSYLAGQKGRGLRVWTEYVSDRRYMSLYSLVTTGDLIGADFNYNLVPNQLDPLDYAEEHRRPHRFTAVVTNVETGQAEYPLVEDMKRDVSWVRASASLPLISRIVPIDGGKYLDGGIADSIPLARSIADGHRRNVVILTREAGYRKSPNRAMALVKLRYARYPKFVEAMATRHERYNAALDLIRAEQAAGRAFVLRPDRAPDIGRVEKDPAKLRALHDEGWAVAKREFDRLAGFLSDH